MGRSKAQDALMAELVEMYPTTFITDEVYIGDLICERGYTLKEIERELGHKPHKMFVDIVMRDSDRTVAVEYHGEQHYSLVGNMTKTTADLLLNQQLDQEKSWILNRIGIPLVAVPFDMYIDESILEHMIDEATEECLSSMLALEECPQCSRHFPRSQMTSMGLCKNCTEEAAEAREEQRAPEPRKPVKRMRATTTSVPKAKSGSSWRDFIADDEDDGEEMSYEEEMKERARQYRREQYQKWKNSPEYAAQKEEARRRRKEEYKKAKAARKASDK